MKFVIFTTSEGRYSESAPAANAKRIEAITKGGRAYQRWVIEINTLQELMDLALRSERQQIILGPDDDYGFNGKIEIYDTWRE